MIGLFTVAFVVNNILSQVSFVQERDLSYIWQKVHNNNSFSCGKFCWWSQQFTFTQEAESTFAVWFNYSGNVFFQSIIGSKSSITLSYNWTGSEWDLWVGVPNVH